MKKKLILIGADLEVIELAEYLGWVVTGIVDNFVSRNSYFKYPILGDDKWLIRNSSNPDLQNLLITIDSPKCRENLYSLYSSSGFVMHNVIGSNALRGFICGPGTLIQRTAHISTNVSLGNCVKINCGANLMHDVSVGSYTTIAPSSVLLGYVKIGSKCFIGAGSTILPKVKIGDGSVVGAGSVVTKDVMPGSVVKGVPAKP